METEDPRAGTDEEQQDAEESVHDDDLHQNPNSSKWEDSFQRLLKYREEHGDTLVPNRYPADPHLGSWVSTQRRQFKIMTTKGGGTTPMTQSRARRLEEVGFQWTTRDPRHVPWEKRYEELAAFKERFGHSQVPIGWKENVALSNWVSTQRQEYKLMLKGRNTRLTPERINLLDKINFVWEAQRGGPRRQQRATVSVPEQAHPVQVRNKVRKGDYAQMMANTAQMMLPGAYPMMPFPIPMMPGMFSPEQTEEMKKKMAKDGEEGETKGSENEEGKKDGANASAVAHPYFNPQMMMNPQMMAAMGWPMMPAGTPPAGPMAFGFFPMSAPYMMPGWPQAKTDAQTSPTEADGSPGKKRKSPAAEESSEGVKKVKTDGDKKTTTEEKNEAGNANGDASDDSEV